MTNGLTILYAIRIPLFGTRRWLTEIKHIEPYEHYCEHCDTLYRRVLEPLGFEYDIDLGQCGNAKCRIVVKQKPDTTKPAR